MSVVAFVILFTFAWVEHRRDPKSMPSVSELYDVNRPTPPPPLADDRKVVEQDCSQPPVDPTANLKCR